MRNLEIGLGLFPIEPPRRIVEIVKSAEELGYSHIWMGDSQVIWREVYVNLGAAAQATHRIILAGGVTNPLTRHITVTASALAALSELTDGRVALGIGAGDSSVETLGHQPATLRQLENSIQQIRGLLAGEQVATERGNVRMEWVNIPPIPVFIGASGPRILRLAGKIADGAIILVGTDPTYLKQAMECIRQGAESVGRDLEATGFKYICWAPCAISTNGSTARDSVKAHVARVMNRPLPYTLSPKDQASVSDIARDYDYSKHMVVGTKHGTPVPDHLVTKFALAGTVEECREQVRRIADIGLHQIAIIPHTTNPFDRLHLVRTFAEEVIGHL